MKNPQVVGAVFGMDVREVPDFRMRPRHIVELYISDHGVWVKVGGFSAEMLDYLISTAQRAKELLGPQHENPMR